MNEMSMIELIDHLRLQAQMYKRGLLTQGQFLDVQLTVNKLLVIRTIGRKRRTGLLDVGTRVRIDCRESGWHGNQEGRISEVNIDGYTVDFGNHWADFGDKEVKEIL